MVETILTLINVNRKVTLGTRLEVVGVSLDGAGDAMIEVQNFDHLGSVTNIFRTVANGERLTVQLA